MTTVIDAHEDRDMLSADVPNAFIQAKIKKKKGDEKIIMKITGKLVDILIRLAPEVYSGYVVYEKGRRVIYVEVLLLNGTYVPYWTTLYENKNLITLT